jgi:hypothetical protein
MHHVETVTPPSVSPSTPSDVPEPNPDFIEKSTIFGNIKVNTEGTSNEPSPVTESNLTERHGVLSIKVNAEGTPEVSITPVAKSQQTSDEAVDSPKCACGNPVDMTNSDCVDYGLCKDHEMDV